LFCVAFVPRQIDAKAASYAPLQYPEAKHGAMIDDYNGVKVPDPYRWMEDLNSEQTKAWVLQEAKLADSYLERLPGREAVKKQLAKLLDSERYGIPFHRANRYFYTHNPGLRQQSILYTTIELNGVPKVAFDPNSLSKTGTVAIAGYVPSPDGTKLVYGLAQGGSDWTEWHIREVDSGKDSPDVLRWTKYYEPVFDNDGKGIYYGAFPQPPPGEELKVRDLGNAVYYRRLAVCQAAH
jgi:prolyl oligopeptidase